MATPEEEAVAYGLDPKRRHAPSSSKPARRRPPTRSDKLKRAKAAGRRGEAAPAWVDDAELLAEYDAGASEIGDQWAGDVDEPAASSAPETDGSEFTSSPAPAPAAALPLGGRLSPSTRTISPSSTRTTGPAGDVAGAFLGLIAAAFVVNVIKGTWTQWLRAKFLNQVGGAARADPNAAPGLPAPSPTPTLPIPTSFGLTGGVPQGVPFGGAQAAQSQAGTAQAPIPFGGATAVGSQAGST